MTTTSKKGNTRHISGYLDENGNFFPIIIVDGKPRHICDPYFYQIAAGNVPNHTAFRIHTMIGSADNTEKDVTGINAVTDQPLLSVAEQLKIISSSSFDTAGSSGTHTALIFGLDENFDEIIETVSMNGIIGVTTTNTYLRINFVDVTSAGNGSTIGDISIQDSGGTVYGAVPAGDTRLNQGYYTIPRSKQAFILDYGAGGQTGNVTTKGTIRLKSTACPCSRSINRDLFFTEAATDFQNAQHFENFQLPLLVPAKGAFKLTVQRTAGATAVSGNARVDFYVEDAS